MRERFSTALRLSPDPALRQPGLRETSRLGLGRTDEGSAIMKAISGFVAAVTVALTMAPPANAAVYYYHNHRYHYHYHGHYYNHRSCYMRNGHRVCTYR
jgi:hypothetical protein